MSALKKDGLQVWLRRAVWLLLLGSFGCIFLVIALRGHWSLGPRRMLFCALLAAGVLVLRRFLPLVDRLAPGRWRALFGGGLMLLFALQLGSGFLLLQDLTTSPFDTEAVLRTATELAQGTVPALYNDYFASVDGTHSDVTADFGQAFYWMLWAGAFIAAIRGIRNRRQPGESGLFLCAICLLGILSFLTLWEANARYPFCYSCCLLLFGVSLLAAPHSEIQSA